MIYGKLPVVFLSAIASEKQGSTNSVIAGYILSHLSEMENLGIQEVARCCHVSVSFISRFCREIGLSDFAELRELLATSRMIFEEEPREGYASAIGRRISQVEESVDLGQLQALCQEIHRYQKVAAFGLLKAEAASLNLQSDLLMLGKQIYTNVSYAQQLEYITHADQDTLILIFSYTGSYFDCSAEYWRREEKNRPRIWMIAGQDRTYPPFIQQKLLFSSHQDQTGHPYQLLFLSSMIAQEYARLFGHSARTLP